MTTSHHLSGVGQRAVAVRSRRAPSATLWLVLVFGTRLLAALVLFYFCAQSQGNMRPDQGLTNAAFGR